MAVTATRRVQELLHIARAAGVTLLTDGDRVGLRGPAAALAALRPLVQAVKPELLALLRQHAANDAPAEPENRPVQSRSWSGQGIPLVDPEKSPGGPKSEPGWNRLHGAYVEHASRCPTCTAAGVTGGRRCPVGDPLWQQYRDAFAQEGLPRHSRSPTPERPADLPGPAGWPHAPASPEEIERMAARELRALAAGLSHDEADSFVDRLLLRDRSGPRDFRSCLECSHVRAAGSGWWCASQRAPLARQFVVSLHRCPLFRGAEQ